MAFKYTHGDKVLLADGCTGIVAGLIETKARAKLVHGTYLVTVPSSSGVRRHILSETELTAAPEEEPTPPEAA